MVSAGESPGRARWGAGSTTGAAGGGRRAGCGMLPPLPSVRDAEADKEGVLSLLHARQRLTTTTTKAPVLQVRWKDSALLLSLRIPSAVRRRHRKLGVLVLLAVLVVSPE